MYTHHFAFNLPSRITSREKFLLLYSSPTVLNTTPEKLKYFRHKNGMYIKDIAQTLNIDRSTYMRYENNTTEYCPLTFLNDFATLLNIPIVDILDDYHLFLYSGQGSTLLKLRKELNLTQKTLGSRLGVDRYTVRCWEKEYHRITRSTYEKLFHNPIL